MGKRATIFLLIPTLTLATTIGCSSNEVKLTQESTSQLRQGAALSDASAVAPADAGVSATELARIQSYLDARYTAKDVWRTFETKLGQTIDCIDWFAQPGVKAMAAMGTPITQIPSPPPLPAGAAKPPPIPDWGFNGAPDKHGVPRECPPKSTPMVRVTVAEIQTAGGLDAYLRPQRVTPPDVAENTDMYAHDRVKYSGSSTQIYYGQSWLSVSYPTPFPQYGGNGDHSLAQTWMVSGTGYNVPTNLGAPCPQGACTDPGQPNCQSSACLQIIEIGWKVEQDPPPIRPRFFIMATNDGYYTQCYGTNPCLNGDTPFVQYQNTWVTNGAFLPINPPGNGWQQFELNVDTYNVNGTWYVYANGPIGYYKSTASGYPTNFFTGSMVNTAQKFEAGGEVRDHTELWIIPMGSGASATSGYPQAAYLHDFMVFTTDNGTSFSFTPMDDAGDNYLARGVYDHLTANNPFPNVWNNVFFFGNAPKVFWGQNFGWDGPCNWNPFASFSAPSYDWAPNYYKGSCGYKLYGQPPSYDKEGSPITGLSAYPSGASQAHSILCNFNREDITVPTDGKSCYQVLFNPNSAQNCGQNANWANGNAAGECNCSDFVLGVSQQNTGIHSLLCCPAHMTHTSCTTQIFYGQNSNAYGPNSQDWDPNYFKGQCPSGQYVAGVSSVPNGAPYALLCCNRCDSPPCTN